MFEMLKRVLFASTPATKKMWSSKDTLFCKRIKPCEMTSAILAKMGEQQLHADILFCSEKLSALLHSRAYSISRVPIYSRDDLFPIAGRENHSTPKYFHVVKR